MDLELSGKVALVTAASRGIGRAIAERLVLEGATVAVSSRQGAPLEAALADLSRVAPYAADRVVALPADLAEAVSGGRLVRDVIGRFGRLDILVSNSPGPRLMPAIEATDEDWLDAYAKLLRPAVQLSRSAATHMVERGSGSIVFMTSTWVKEPRNGSVLSSAMRSAVSALSKQMASELAPRGIRVNQVMPGVTATDRTRQIAASEAARSGSTIEEEIERVAASIPLRRIALPEEIADAVAFLVSARSAFTTGQSLAIDGGNGRSIL